ncbi:MULTISPECIES: hypothetical protein [Streptomyces]|uniref:Lipoprotein n=1 Tax=Streptomyces eurythermus TaxID=42237 RepID=A0ABW6Z3A0_9ACTN|nr:MULTISPECIES: hypothetical protein [Streptomyces]QIS69632.1 hypothetical protein HB370_06185 [Streptomyces sp. DSM 40868]
MRTVVGLGVAASVIAGTASCSDSGGDQKAAPVKRSEEAANASPAPAHSSPAPADPLLDDGVPTSDGLSAALPKKEELPAGWVKSGENSVGWRDAADAVMEGEDATACGATGLQAADLNGSDHGVISSVGNEDKGDGAHFSLTVLMDSDNLGAELTGPDRVELVTENMTRARDFWSCFSPGESGIGDDSLSYDTDRFANVHMRVGPVEVFVHTPRSGDSPSAEDWARVLEQRIRSVLAGQAPTARIAVK